MEYRKLGKSNLKVSLLGYGSWALSGKGWFGVNTKESIKTLEAALHEGINFFDTAPIYGFGKSEELLGEILNDCRDQVIIATKCGLVWDKYGHVSHSLKESDIRRSIEGSLVRLKTDYIDLFQLHWPDSATPLSETAKILIQLKDEGLIREIGISNYNPEQFRELIKLLPIVSYQGLYNRLQRDAEKEIIPICKENEISFISYSSLAQGLLGGLYQEGFSVPKNDIRRFNNLFTNEELFNNSLSQIRGLGKNPVRKSLEFLAKNETVTSILVSMTKTKHLEENVSSLN